MGISAETVRFLIEAKRAGACFESLATLGKQDMWLSPERLAAFLHEFGIWPPGLKFEQFKQDYASSPSRFSYFAGLLGANGVVSCDASAYEGASLVHDLNNPIGAEWENKCDALIDGGTLEHVFNFPVAIANCMRMVKPGGRLFIFTTANNYCGHGFYQFSPELFYRVLSPENGFEIERMHMVEDSAGVGSLLGNKYWFPITGQRHAVADPQKVGGRVLLVNEWPVLLFAQAKKVGPFSGFKQTPQQSDYVSQWRGREAKMPAKTVPDSGGLQGLLRARLPESVWRELIPKWAWLLNPLRSIRFRRTVSFSNRKLYQPTMKPAAGEHPAQPRGGGQT